MIQGAPAEPGSRDRRTDRRLLLVAVGIELALLILAIVGTLYCPDQVWVDAAGWLAAGVWVIALVIGIRYIRRGRDES